MLRNTSFAFVAILLWAAFAFAQNGSVQGVVYRSDGVPAFLAAVNLDGVDGNEHHHPFHASIWTDMAGGFVFHMIPPGTYNISASMWFQGFASSVIDVAPEQTTHVTLTLQDPDSDGHEGHNDALAPVNLEGTAHVTGDSLHRNYFLDTNGDGTPDYRLTFGPWWYNSGTAAHRPHEGDHVTIYGGLFSYGTPPMVVVWDINGQHWRDPVHGGHGGYGGDHGSDCDPDSVTRIELAGHVTVSNVTGWHGEHHAYSLTSPGMPHTEYLLDFGAEAYDPGNGAMRPNNGDSIAVVGGKIDCPGSEHPIVIVYEINGLFWRQPGDTSGIGPMSTEAVDPHAAVAAPVSYLTAHNYPNPFNPVTTISYSLPLSGHVEVAIFDITGREVSRLVNGFQPAGSYAVAWDGRAFASGIYLCRVTVNNVSVTNRMVLMK